jgi:transposase
MDYCTTIGIDVSDRTSKVCVMSKEGGARRVLVETTCATTKEGFGECLSKFDRAWPVVFETGTHCRWMKRHFESMGFKTIVANPSEVKLITDSNAKNDRGDARKLARIALADAELLKPVKLRGEGFQRMLRLHESRLLLVKCRTSMVVQIRCFAKSCGFRLPDCPAGRFHELDRSSWPPDFEQMVWPMMDMVETTNLKIAAYESMIRKLAATPEFKAMTERAREVYGVGLIGSTVVVAAIDGDASRFAHARDVGPYLGLTPKKSQSGESDPQLGITKAGNSLVRKVLVECANVVMMDNAPDTDLKLKGLRVGAGGGKVARKKAKAAVARGLAVLVVALLKDPGREYVPLSEDGRRGFERYHAERQCLPARKAAEKAP